MKTNENPSKIVSTSIALMLCFMMLLFAVMMLWDKAAPTYAHVYAHASVTGTATSTPTSGSAGTKITVSGTVMDASTPTPVSTGTVFFGYTSNLDCSNGINLEGSTTHVSNGSFSGTFTWPTGPSAGTYHVCAQIFGITGSSGPLTLTSDKTFQVTASASVSADSSSYTVGDTMTVSGTGFPASTAVTVELQSSDGNTTTTLGTVTTGADGAINSQVYKVPAHPLNSVVVKVIAADGSTLATSSSFTVKAKATTAKPTPTPKPAPVPTSPPAPAYIPPPPVVLPATPTPVPTATDTPTAVPTDTPTPEPSPTVAPAPTPVRVVAKNNNAFSNLLGGRLPTILAIGLGTLLGLGILFFVGRLVMRKFLSPAPPPNMPPSGAPPWSRSQEENLHGNTGMNGVSLAQTMPINDFSPGYGGFPPANGQTQQVPFNSPFAPGNSGFPPANGQTQQVPFNSPFAPGNSGFPPTNGQTQQVPFNGPFTPGPGGGFAPGNSPEPVPFNGPFASNNGGFPPPGNVTQEPFPPGNDWFAPSQ